MHPRRAILALAILLSGCAAERGPAAAPSPSDRGHRLAQAHCASCHAVEPGGRSPRPNARGFAEAGLRHTVALEGRLANLTRLGHYGMPPQQLTPDEVRDLTAYIEGLGAN